MGARIYMGVVLAGVLGASGCSVVVDKELDGKPPTTEFDAGPVDEFCRGRADGTDCSTSDRPITSASTSSAWSAAAATAGRTRSGGEECDRVTATTPRAAAASPTAPSPAWMTWTATTTTSAPGGSFAPAPTAACPTGSSCRRTARSARYRARNRTAAWVKWASAAATCAKPTRAVDRRNAYAPPPSVDAQRLTARPLQYHPPPARCMPRRRRRRWAVRPVATGRRRVDMTCWRLAE
jgi:hypothetical protein